MAELADRTARLLPAFLSREERQPERFERAGGVVRMMSGGTAAHDRIAVDIAAELRSALRGSDCAAHGSSLKVVSPRADVMYPDAFVRCGRLEPGSTVVADPVIVFEVLSQDTAQRELTLKRLAYKTIPSLKVIVYVHQDRLRIDLVRRQADGPWDDGQPLESLEARLDLPELGISLPLAEVYDGVELAAA
jgi:Uma2 family endonuclease